MKTASLFIMLTAMLLVSACTSTGDLLDSGEYDQALDRIAKKFEGKKRRSTEDVKLLERSFNALAQIDQEEIELLRARGRSYDLERALEIVDAIDRRQDRIRPLYPIKSKDGFRPRLDMIDVRNLGLGLEDALVWAIERESDELMTAARSGNKLAAREAYGMFGRLVQLRGFNAVVDSVREEARALGINRVAITNYVGENVPFRSIVQASLDSRGVGGTDSWSEVIYDTAEFASADLEVRLIVNSLRIGRNRTDRDEYDRVRRIQDGWDYALDGNGNVVKDSTGNDIRIERYRDVRAVFVRTEQEKEARINATVEIHDLRTGTVINSYPLRADYQFYHRAQTYYGDQRALRSSERRQIDLLPFPSDIEMVERVIEELSPVHRREIRRFI